MIARLTTIACILFVNFCFSQTDTTFFDTDWKPCKRSNAKYYQLVEKRGNLFIEKDFFMNNKPQSIAECLSMEPYIRNGKWVEYRGNGTKANTGYYTNEKASGVWTWWDDDKKDSIIGEYKPDGNIFILNKGHYVTRKGKKQFVVVEGKGSPTIVFITGKGDAQYNYRVVYKEIKKTNQIFSYDRVGLGNSEFIDNLRRVDTMAYELNELLTKENIKPPYVLVGHSLGSYVMRCFYNMYPKKVAGMVFIDAACELDYKEGLNVRSDSEKVKFIKNYESFKYRPSRTKGQNAESVYMYDFDKNNYSTDYNIVKDLKLPNNIPITVFLSTKIKQDDSFDKRDLKIREDFFEAWKKQAPQLKLITTSKSGHYIYVEEPDLVINGIKNMLKELNDKK